MDTGFIFDVKRFAINDGPGIRLTVFFKGCPLSCVWCHNPESLAREPQKMMTDSKCIQCGSCGEVCEREGCRLTELGLVTDMSKCTACGNCVEVCPTEAAEISGRWETLESLMQEIEGQRVFFDQSGGGVTFSGGEPLMQADFLLELLKACQTEHIHRTVDTSGFAKTETLMRVREHTNLFLYDLKHIDSERHRELTGVGNKIILNNLVELAASGADIMLRVPLINGLNDDPHSVTRLAEFISTLPGAPKVVHLLPYHAIAEMKRTRLGLAKKRQDLQPPNEAQLSAIIQIFETHSLQASIG